MQEFAAEHPDPFGNSEPSARRAARYQMYRKWVFARYGKLGRSIRIRIPPCVVEQIRNRFREPGCHCRLGGELFACRAHGYVGHRDAPGPAQAEPEV